MNVDEQYQQKGFIELIELTFAKNDVHFDLS